VKVRIGIGLGGAAGPAELAGAASQLEDLGIDSLWLSEMVYGPMVEPVIGMTWALARTRKLKVGTGVAVLPGRHPVLVAKQLASLAGLAPARVLPVFGLQPARAAERPLFSVPAGQRGAVFDESVGLIRRLLAEDTVSFEGRFFTVRAASVGPRPAKPLDIWLGGSAPAGLSRVGRLGDGWLASFMSPADARAGREAIQAAAAAAGREVDPEHFGISLPVADGPVSDELAAQVASRRPGTDPADIVAAGWADARRKIEQYVAAGLSKFVIRPAGRAADPAAFAQALATELKPLQT
jgi:probable F420-dependent oxidoreductase